MLESLFGKNQSLVGVDISTSAVRLLELSKHGEQYRVDAFAQVYLPDKAVEGKNFKDEEAIVNALQEAIALSGCKTKLAAISVSDSAIISKVIQLEDGLSDSEAEELVVLEADKYIPFAIEDVSLDFHVLAPSEKRQGFNDVLVVASRAENISARVNLLSQCGLETKIVDVESFAVQRASQLLQQKLFEAGDNKIIAIIDIGEFRTQLTVIHKGNTVFTQEEEFGGRQLTDEIMRHYSMSYDEAMKAKIEGHLPEDYQEAVLFPFMAMVVLQIKRILQYFYSTTQFAQVDKIVLAGGTAMIDGLTGLVEKDVGIPSVLATPIADMSIGKRVNLENIVREGPALMTVCGLALRKFGMDR